MHKGKLLIISAPSGSGKTTLVKYLMQQFEGLEFSISATSRPPRGAEKHQVDYYFMSAEAFQQKINNHEFVEWEEVYRGKYYGTLKAEVERIRAKGHTVVFDVDVVGGLNIKKMYTSEALAIFIKPPSIQALKSRLRDRATDDEAEIEKRIEKAKEEMQYAGQFDKIIVNDNLEQAQKVLNEIVKRFLDGQ